MDLFSGIGGFSLGLERAGMETVAFCEIEPYCQAVLRKHWPKVSIHDDIRTLDGTKYPVDVVCGGFPCQPFSVAGKRRGKEDDRHIWPEMLRVIKQSRPTWVIGENVAGIIRMELDQVLSDLEDSGYTTRTFVIPACAVDAPHRRDRIWAIAFHSDSKSESSKPKHEKMAELQCNVADTNGAQRKRGRLSGRTHEEYSDISGGCRWEPEPGVGRVANGIPSRMDRLRALGNAVVSEVVEQIGKAIMKCHLLNAA